MNEKNIVLELRWMEWNTDANVFRWHSDYSAI